MLTRLSFAAVAVLTISLALLAEAKLFPAKAASWSGCYGGGAVGYTTAPTDTSLAVPGGAVKIESLALDGHTFTVLGGCDLQMQKFVLGAWADHSWDDADFAVTATGAPALLSASLDRRWAVGGRAGYVFHDVTLVYALIGYTQAETSAISSPAAGVSFAVPTLDGYVVGGGAEVALGSNLFLQAQYTYSDYQEASIALAPGLDLKLEPDVHTARVGLLYRFNFQGSALPVFESKPLK